MAKSNFRESLDYSDHEGMASWSNQSERLRWKAAKAQAAQDLLSGMSTAKRAASELDVGNKHVSWETTADVANYLLQGLESAIPDLIGACADPGHSAHGKALRAVNNLRRMCRVCNLRLPPE